MRDVRVIQKLRRSELSLESVVAKGKNLSVLDVANASLGGTIIDVSKKVHPKFLQLMRNISREAGLRWCGIDVMVEGSVTAAPKQYWVLEVNAAPGLKLFAASSPATRKRVLQIYEEIFRRALK